MLVGVVECWESVRSICESGPASSFDECVAERSMRLCGRQPSPRPGRLVLWPAEPGGLVTDGVALSVLLAAARRQLVGVDGDIRLGSDNGEFC